MLVPGAIAIAIIAGGGLAYYVTRPLPPAPERATAEKGTTEKAAAGSAGAKAPAAN